jgi:hypothetical protein
MNIQFVCFGIRDGVYCSPCFDKRNKEKFDTIAANNAKAARSRRLAAERHQREVEKRVNRTLHQR